MKQLTTTLILLLSISLACAEDKSEDKAESKSELNSTALTEEQSRVTGLNLHLDSLKTEAKKISDQLDSIDAVNDAIEEANRPKGVGGAGGSIIRIYSLDVTPIKDLIQKDIAELGDSSYFVKLGIEDKIKGTYETFMSFGGRGLYGFGNGLKIGGEFASLWKRYRSTSNDTTYHTLLFTMYGGVILEKSFENNNHSFTVGTMLGGGAMGITGGIYSTLDYPTLDDSTFCGSTLDDESDWEWEYDVASLFAGDLHFSYNYSILPWFHVGVEANALLLASTTGFKYGDSFTTINPGGGIKFMFGRVY